MFAQVQILTRSNQSQFAEAHCDDCRWDSRNTVNRELTIAEAKDLADFHNESNHADEMNGQLDAYENSND